MNSLKLQDIERAVPHPPRECVASSRFSIGYHPLFPQRKTNEQNTDLRENVPKSLHWK